MLIVADQQAATIVSAAPHNLPCVTLEGHISRPGSVFGGWQGNGVGPVEALLIRKVDLALSEAAAEAARKDCVFWKSAAEEAQLMAAQAEAIDEEEEIAAMAWKSSESARSMALVAAAAADQLTRSLVATKEALKREAEICAQAAASCTGDGGEEAGRKKLAEMLDRAKVGVMLPLVIDV